MLYVGPLVSISPITDRLSLVFSPAQSLPLQLMFSPPLTQVALERTLGRWSVYKGCACSSAREASMPCVCVCVCVCVRVCVLCTCSVQVVNACDSVCAHVVCLT